MTLVTQQVARLAVAGCALLDRHEQWAKLRGDAHGSFCARSFRALGIALALVVACAAALALAAPATAQTPTAPANGAQLTASDVVLRWTLDPGWHTRCVQWAARPETSYPGGPFLAPNKTICALDPQDVAFLLDELDIRRYYWHIEVAREVCAEGDDCRYEERWGPTAYFDSVAAPPPPRPKGCSRQAVDAMAEDFLLPYAEKRYPSYYNGEIEWAAGAPLCRDLNGDGDRELIVRLTCCTGGSLSPWAIFKHNAVGEWRMTYAQVRDTVFRLRVQGRTVRTMLPAPYEGACTRYVRYRLVKWNGKRFTSRTTKHSRVRSRC